MVEHPEKIETLSINKIIPNREQKISFSEEDVKNKAENIKANGQVEPIIVRPLSDNNDQFEICEGQDIYDAIVYLKDSTVQVITRNYTLKKGCEIALASIFRSYKLTSIERENHIYTRFKNGKYKTYRELSRVIPLTPERIGNLIYSKEQREKLSGTDKTNGTLVSTEVIIACKDLKLNEQRKFCKRVEEGTIPASAVREAVKFLRNCPEGAREAILKNKYPFFKAKVRIDDTFRQYQHYKKQIEKLENSNSYAKWGLFDITPNDKVEVFKSLFKATQVIEPSFIADIDDDRQKKWAISYVKWTIGLNARLLKKLEVINTEQYQKLLITLNLESNVINYVKEDGFDFRMCGKEDWSDGLFKKSKSLASLKKVEDLEHINLSGDNS